MTSEHSICGLSLFAFGRTLENELGFSHRAPL